MRRGTTAREVASDQLASYFNGQGWLAEFPLTRATYIVTVEMIWYDRHDPRRIDDRATHAIEHFSILPRHHGETLHGRTSSVRGAHR